MRRALYATAALVALTACNPGNTSPGASAELTSIFRFAEFPGARYIQENVYPGSIGPFAMPGNSGSRVYETTATIDAIKSHYEQLARANGWNYAATDPVRLGYAPGSPYRGTLLSMVRDRFSFAVVLSPTTDGLDVGGGAYYPKVPVPPPDGNTTTPPPISPSPEPTPSVVPTPTPTPYGGAYYLRIEGSARQP